ncbi:hypothetical protein ACOMHN_008169 [Nucella lapillus]
MATNGQSPSEFRGQPSILSSAISSGPATLLVCRIPPHPSRSSFSHDISWKRALTLLLPGRGGEWVDTGVLLKR